MADPPTWLFVVAIAALYLGAVVVAARLWVRWALAPAVYVLEGCTVTAALTRSRQLVLGASWRVFGILVLAQVTAALVEGIVLLPMMGIGALVSGGMAGPAGDVTFIALTSLGTVLSTALVTPFAAAVPTLVYVDQRTRRHGLDIQLRMAADPADRPLVEVYAVREVSVAVPVDVPAQRGDASAQAPVPPRP